MGKGGVLLLSPLSQALGWRTVTFQAYTYGGGQGPRKVYLKTA